MQFKLQHDDSKTDDPHDTIGAQLRDLAPRLAHGPSELNVAPAASPEPVSEQLLRGPPLNDNIGDIRNPTPSARFGRGVLLIVCVGIAATAVWHAYGEEVKQKLSYLMPPLLAGAPALTPNATEPQDATSQIAAPQPTTNPAPAQEATTAALTAPTEPVTASAPADETPPTPTALPPELAQSIETMAREIISLKQTVEQLKTGQQQLSRDVAKVTEHEARRKLTAQASKPAPLPRPQRASPPAAPRTPPYSPPVYSQGQQTNPQGTAQREAYIPPPAPTQLPPQPGDTSVPRPPMPLR